MKTRRFLAAAVLAALPLLGGTLDAAPPAAAPAAEAHAAEPAAGPQWLRAYHGLSRELSWALAGVVARGWGRFVIAA